MSHRRCCGTEHTEHCICQQFSPFLLKFNLPYVIEESSSVNLNYKKAFPIHQIFFDTLFSNCELAQTNIIAWIQNWSPTRPQAVSYQPFTEYFFYCSETFAVWVMVLCCMKRLCFLLSVVKYLTNGVRTD